MIAASLVPSIGAPVAADGRLPSAAVAQRILAAPGSEPWAVLERGAGERVRRTVTRPIEAIARNDGQALLDALNRLGLTGGERHGRHVSGHLPVIALASLGDIDELHDVRGGTLRHAAGVVTTEGDRAVRADEARTRFGADGAGVVVGVVSDSYDCLGGAAADIASGDLPDDVRVLREVSDCEGATDEGRALMQIVHDIAPEADLLFRSGAGGAASVANAILELSEEADIVVDDALSTFAPWFQEGIIARASRSAVDAGVVHVTAAGNEGRLSYESDHREHVQGASGLRLHDFDAGPDVDVLQSFELPEGETLELFVQWDDPAFSVSGPPGAATDLDLYVTDGAGRELLASGSTANLGRDPNERLGFFNPPGSGVTRFNLMIVTAAGEAPGRVKTIVFGRFAGRFLEHDTRSATVVGHPNADSAITVGAVDHAKVPPLDGGAPPVRLYSSAGGTPLLFDGNGGRFVEPFLPAKPDLVAPDGVSTTFFGAEGGGEGFVGTSASAPHVAGVVALMLGARAELTPRDVHALLGRGATDVLAREGETSSTGVGFDADSGDGLVDAEATLALLDGHEPLPESPAPVSRDVVALRAPVVVGAGAFGWWAPLLLVAGSCRRRFGSPCGNFSA